MQNMEKRKSIPFQIWLQLHHGGVKQMENSMEMLRDIKENDTFWYFGDEQEKLIYARYLSYKAVQAAYALRVGCSSDSWTWAICRRRFTEEGELRQRARSVINDTLCTYAKSGFLFPVVEARQGKAEAFQQANVLYTQALLMHQLPAISLYDSEREEKQMVHYFFLLVEIAYYAYQLQGGQCNPWEVYLTELQNSPAMRQVLCLVFYDALLNVDFTAGWRQAENKAESHLLRSWETA